MKLRRSVASVALAATVLAFVTAAQAQPTTLRLSSPFVAKHASSRGMEIFKAEAARLSGGSIEVELIPNTPGAAGTREYLDEVRTQNVFGIWIGSAHLSRLVPEIGALGLPYVFDNYDQVARALRGSAGAAIEAKLAAKGFTSLGWMMYGAHHVTNSKRPLRTLDDFRDLKIRVQPNETHLAIFRALGANPVAMDLKDLFPALRQGDIDAHENSYWLLDNDLYTQNQKYLSDSAHLLDLIAFVVNRKAFISLQPAQQKAIREAAAIAVAQQWKMVDAEEADSLVKLKEKGVQFDPLPRETRAALRRATAVVVKDARKRIGDEIIDNILAASKPGPARATTASTMGPLAGQGRISTKRN
jgi:tripartite ATP-independent transporter DctP family solute receptor